MLAKMHADKLPEVKKNIENWHEYFDKNFKRYNEYMKFVFETSISDADQTALAILKKPNIEFNILESQLSRLRGEFAKQEPSLTVKAADGIRPQDLTPNFLRTMEVIQGHLNEIFFNSTNDALEYNIYSDILAGGFSAAHIFTDYVNEMSFEQCVKMERVFDPCMTIFDPLARLSHKGDGAYCALLVPKTKEEFENMFGSAATKKMKFTRRNLQGFNWTYRNQDQDIVLLADYYFKKKKKEKVIMLSSGHTMLEKHYKDFLEHWNGSRMIEQAPIPIKERETVIDTIERYWICENKILEHEKTYYSHLPIVFIDGNSVTLRQANDGASEQMTRPFVYHAKGVQRLKNLAGQTVGADIENMVEHKFIVAVESIPNGYEEAYKNVQQASTLAYNAFYQGDTNVPLPPPREVNRVPIPPIVESTFLGTDRVTQTILGTYDSVLGVGDKEISGVAIQQGAMQSNAAAIPYLQGYINGLERLAEIAVDIIPKIYVTPRTIPIIKSDGKRSYQLINEEDSPESIDFHYRSNSLQVKIEAGVSTGIQKQVAIDKIIGLSQAIPAFGDFINSMGLETILDNLDIRGIEHLKAQAVIYMKQIEEKKAMAEQNPPSDPAIEGVKIQAEAAMQIEMAKLDLAADKMEGEHAIAAAKVAVEKQKNEIAIAKVIAEVEQESRKLDMEGAKAASEDARTAVEAAIEVAKHHHEVSRSEQENQGGDKE